MESPDNKYNINEAIWEALIQKGPDFMTELFRIMMNEAMKMERDLVGSLS